MNKVLGFRKVDWNNLKKHYPNISDLQYLENGQVKVVSLAWLEKWCKENKLREEDSDLGLEIAIVNDLLTAAKKAQFEPCKGDIKVQKRPTLSADKDVEAKR